MRGLGRLTLFAIVICTGITLGVVCSPPLFGEPIVSYPANPPHDCNQEDCFTITYVTGDPLCGTCVGGIFQPFQKCVPVDYANVCREDQGMPHVCNGACSLNNNRQCNYTLYHCVPNVGGGGLGPP